MTYPEFASLSLEQKEFKTDVALRKLAQKQTRLNIILRTIRNYRTEKEIFENMIAINGGIRNTSLSVTNSLTSCKKLTVAFDKSTVFSKSLFSFCGSSFLVTGGISILHRVLSGLFLFNTNSIGTSIIS